MSLQELEDKQKLLSEAAEALQSQEEKFKQRTDNYQNRLDNERERRVTAEKEIELLRMELRDAREVQREEERRISDESRLLYAEAFGSINLGLGATAKSDSEVFILTSCITNCNYLTFSFRSTKLG